MQTNNFKVIINYVNRKDRINKYGGNLMATFKITAKDIELASKKKKTENEDEEKTESGVSATSENSNDTTDAYQELVENLSAVDSKYNYDVEKGEKQETELNLDKKSTVEVNEKEVEAQAKDALTEYKVTGYNEIEKDSADEISSKNEDIKDANESKASTVKELEEYYKEAKKTAQDNALSNGVGRSSIIISKLEAFDEDKISTINELDKKLSATIEDLNSQIQTLEIEKEKALSDFDLVYASKLNTEIASIKEELNEKNEEVLEYNNDIAEIEAKYTAGDIENNNEVDQDYYDAILAKIKSSSLYSEGLTTVIFEEKEELVTNYLLGLSKDEAINALENNEYLKTVLASDYNKVYQQMQSRSD